MTTIKPRTKILVKLRIVTAHCLSQALCMPLEQPTQALVEGKRRQKESAEPLNSRDMLGKRIGDNNCETLLFEAITTDQNRRTNQITTMDLSFFR
jgi:hypothetical protein